MSEVQMFVRKSPLFETWRQAGVSAKLGQSKCALFITNVREFDINLSDENYQQLSVFLSIYVNGNDGEVKAVAPVLLELVEAKKEDIKVKAQTQSGKVCISEFLVECVRCVNFATHAEYYIKEFIKIMYACGISIDGNPESCLGAASFKDLRYDPTAKLVIMRI